MKSYFNSFTWQTTTWYLPNAASLCHVVRSGNDKNYHKNRFFARAQLCILDPGGLEGSMFSKGDGCATLINQATTIFTDTFGQREDTKKPRQEFVSSSLGPSGLSAGCLQKTLHPPLPEYSLTDS